MKIIILSVSSDIGFALASDWKKKNIEVIGTYRTFSKKCEILLSMGVKLFQCDLNSKESITEATGKIKNCGDWDVLISSAGTQEPIGKFDTVNIDNWESSLNINFLSQMRFLHNLISNRNNKYNNIPRVLFFAGGGTNNATQNYSSYTVSKIACIKMCELLDAEYPDTIFSIVGPGWVNTKIHNETIKAGNNAGNNLQRTLDIIESEKFYPIDKVVQCCNWLLKAEKSIVGGRNFSAVHDPWEEDKISKVSDKEDYFKLRRFGNDLF
jgi:short-subunit dehydrogenase